MKLFYLSFSAFLLAFVVHFTASAQIIPRQFSYQGYLEENGLPFDGSATFTFTIGGWTETQTLNVDAGLYSATLGANTPIPVALFAQNPVPELQVSVNGVSLSPNTGFLSVPYAFMARYVADTSVTTRQIRDFTILPEDMNPGANATTLVTDTTGTVRWAPVSAVGDNLGNHTMTQILQSDLTAGDIVQIGDDVVLQDINVPGVLGLRGPVGGNSVGIRLGGFLAAGNPVLFGTNNALLFAFGNSEKMRLTTAGQLGLNTNAPDASALMHMESRTQGLLIPRMTSAERTAIATPANGLLVFDTDVNSLFFYDGASLAWATFSTTNLPDGQIWVGNGGAATPVTANGDLTIDNTGLTTIQPDAVESAEILDGTITTLDLAPDAADQVLTTDPAGNPVWETRANFASSALTSGNILVGDLANVATDVPMTGDVAIDNTGLTTIQPDAVESAEILDGTITNLDLAPDAADQVLTTDPAGIPTWEARANFDNTALTAGLTVDAVPVWDGSAFQNSLFSVSGGFITAHNGPLQINNGSLQLADASATYYSVFQTSTQTANLTYTLPPTGGLAGEILINDGFGNLNWQPVPALALVEDADADTRIQVEETLDDDMIRFDLAGTEEFRMQFNPNGQTRIHTGSLNVAIGHNAGEFMGAGVTASVLIGERAGQYVTGSENVAIGKMAGAALTSGNRNVLIGNFAGNSLTTGGGNVYLGRFAGAYTTDATSNIYVGGSAGARHNGSNNVAVGQQAIGDGGTVSTGDDNTALGFQTLYSVNGGIGNSAVGREAGYSNTTGANNTYLGFRAGRNATGSNNVFLGASAGLNETGNNRLYIANTGTNTPLIWGDFSASLARINGALQIHGGSLQLEDASATYYSTFQTTTQTANLVYTLPPTGGLAGEVMVNDGFGNLNWQPAPIATSIEDADTDTKIQVEESPNENRIRFDIAGTEYLRMENNAAGQPRMRLSTKNVILGENAGDNLPNTVERAVLIGTNAGRSLTQGDNIMIGRDAGSQITAGTFNIMIGGAAGSAMTGGIFNVMIGRFCGAYRTTGDRNVFIGSSTAEDFNGGGNVVLGDRAAGAGVARTGSNNVILGNRTMENVNGNNNVAIGPSAGLTNGGSGNVFLGANAGRNETGSNLLYIDNTNTTTPLIWGNFATDQVRINGQLTITGNAFVNGGTAVTSDRRFKKNIRPLESALSKTLKLRGVRYDWRRDEFPDMNFSEEEQLGFIAQEVEEEFPELVQERADGYKGVDYSRLTPILVEAIKELKAEIDALRKENEALRAQVQSQGELQGRVQALEAKLESQQQKLSELVDKLLQSH